jgi:hypothetical protein
VLIQDFAVVHLRVLGVFDPDGRFGLVGNIGFLTWSHPDVGHRRAGR